MAPRAGARRSQAPNDRIFELGVQGRKTGVTLRDTGVRDEHGMQPLEDIFSSPEKTVQVDAVNADEDDVSDDSSGQEMDIENTTAPDPAMWMRTNGNGLKMPLPRSRSPIKTNLQSPARQNPHLNPDSSPVRGSIVGHGERPAPQSVKRKLNFSTSDAPSRQRPQSSSNGKGATNGARNGTSAREDGGEGGEGEEEEEEAILHGEQHESGTDAEESLAMVDQDAEDAPDPDFEDQYNGVGDDVEPGENSHADEPTPDTRPTPRHKKSGRSGENEDNQPAKKKRGRPGKGKAADGDEQEQERGPAKRRRRENETQDDARPEPDPEPPKQKGRGRKPGQKVKPSAGTDETAQSKATTKGKRPRPRVSSPGAADTSLAVVPRGPPLPKSRGLLISRRELPGEDGMKRTRSGRNSYKPLAFWRNEHVDYDQDQTVSDAFGRKSHPSKFVLPSIKEVHRIEESEPERRRRGPSRAGASKAAASKKKRGRGRESDMFDEPAEPWEEDPGVVEGDAVVWQPEHEYAPPALDEDVDVEPERIAIAGAAIETKEIRNATFRFAKTLSLPFYGAGVVDLPPGSEKRPKNSRKMYMTFFVFSGKVLVTVNDSSFRISKGGMWFVPRGNSYSIENDYDEHARVFFSQGCEPPEVPPEEYGAQS